jgi:hypothetical protein
MATVALTERFIDYVVRLTDPGDRAQCGAMLNRRAGWRRWRSDDAGAAEVAAMVVLAPVIVAVAIVIIAVGRGVDAGATVRSAAFAAAQSAALERTPADAVHAAERMAHITLAGNPSCSAPSVAVDVLDFRPGGSVTVVVSCLPRPITSEAAVAGVDGTRVEGMRVDGAHPRGLVHESGLVDALGSPRVGVVTAVVDRFRYAEPVGVSPQVVGQ